MKMATKPLKALKIFYCYAQEDAVLRDKLEKHLSPLKRVKAITGWFDRKIQTGTDWESETKTQFNTAHIVLLLLSPDFFASDKCYQQMEEAVKGHTEEKMYVIPILLRPVLWDTLSIISGLEFLPHDKRAITAWNNEDEAFSDVAQGIREVVKKLLPKHLLTLRDTRILYPKRVDQDPFLSVKGNTLATKSQNPSRDISVNLSTIGKTPAAPKRNAGTANTLRSAGSISATNTNRSRSPRGVQPSKRNRRATPLIILILFLVGILTFLVNNMPGLADPLPTTITITPFSKTVQGTYVLPGVNDPSNIANRKVSIRQLTSTQTATKQVTLTHVHQDPTPATGKITLFNDSPTPHTIKASINEFMVINAGINIGIALDEDVVIPAKSATQPGQITVNAHTVQRGKVANIAAFAIKKNSCCNYQGISAQNQSAFTGGTDLVDYNVLKPSDMNLVTSADQGSLKIRAQYDITEQKKANEQFLDVITCNDPKTTSDVRPNAHLQITTGNITVSATCNAGVYDATAAQTIGQTIAQNALPQKANKDPQLRPNPVLVAGTIIVTKILTQTHQNGSVTFLVQANGFWYYNWTYADKQALKSAVKGKKKALAQTILNSYPGIGNATIDNNGGATLPNNTKQIVLKINAPKKAPLGNA